MENQEKPRFFSISNLKNSLTLKVIVLGMLWLMLLIPLAMTSGLRRDRSNRAAEAEKEVSAKWGAPQRIVAPVMQIGLVRTEETKKGTTKKHEVLTLLPDKLAVTGSIKPERRYRGIYPVLLYRAKLMLDGEFTVALPKLADNQQIAKDDFSLQFGISDIKGITAFELEFGGRSFKSVPGSQLGRGIHCELPAEWLTATCGKPIKFHAELELNGCRELLFQPIGSDFTLKLDSPWPHPSFVGGFLPIERKIGAEGFSAEWKISELNRSYPQSFIDCDKDRFSRENDLGVALVQLAGPYQQVERVHDYATLVIAIVLFAFLIGERAAKIWIHPLQYLFAGLSLVLFYTLLLAFCEHLNFPLSYAISAALIVVLTTGYAFAIFGGRRIPAFLLGLTVALAYALVYALVRLEDYALLVGSGILFAMLAMLMKFTGHLNRE